MYTWFYSVRDVLDPHTEQRIHKKVVVELFMRISEGTLITFWLYHLPNQDMNLLSRSFFSCTHMYMYRLSNFC